MPDEPSRDVTELLVRWRAGDQSALNALLPLVYTELRRLAHQYMRKERPDHTLQSAALVHEAYLRLEKRGEVRFENRSHFLAICAQLMRQILVDYARKHLAAKRGGEQVTLSLDEHLAPAKSRPLDVVALDDALNQLSRMNPQHSRIVEMRFFAGLSIEEAAQALGISPATVKRDWAVARAWLYRELARSTDI